MLRHFSQLKLEAVSLSGTTMIPASPSSSYVCDTLPPPRLAPSPCSDSTSIQDDLSAVVFDPSIIFDDGPAIQDTPPPISTSKSDGNDSGTPPPPTQHPPRKLCVRHQRMADEGTNLMLQQSLDALPLEEREAINTVWSNFSSSPHPRRALILQGLLTMCCFSQLSLLTEQLAHLIRIDPFSVLPREVSLKILGNLDATSLCRAAQVNRQWKTLADDDILWRGICEQHIGQKCIKCGWGLPVLEKKRTYRMHPDSPSAAPVNLPSSSSVLSKGKRMLEDEPHPSGPPMKRQKSELSLASSAATLQELHTHDNSKTFLALASASRDSDENPLLSANPPTPLPRSVTRPWKDVYSERLTIERNWRRGRCTVRTLKGHGDGVMCLQFSETLSSPAFPVLITGSYDRTARVWNMETGSELHVLKGHRRAIRALQFDECKLITGSMDHTIRVWDWRRGNCIRTLTGHMEGVVCLNFDSNVLASGSEDATIKVWNLRTGGAFTLRGHNDWVNSVQLWDASSSGANTNASSSTNVFDSVLSPSTSAAPQIDVGKMLFSASDDGTIRLWDLTLRTCVRQFTGHVGQVQSMKLLLVDEHGDGGKVGQSRAPPDVPPPDHPGYESLILAPPGGLEAHAYRSSPYVAPTAIPARDHLDRTTRPLRPAAASPSVPSISGSKKHPTPVLISGSLDNTLKLWDIETGKTVRTLFGHIEGVWAVASDKLRLVSGSQDRTIKVWNREQGRCTATLVGHCAAVNCLALGEDKIVSGSDDGDIKIWSFSP